MTTRENAREEKTIVLNNLKKSGENPLTPQKMLGISTGSRPHRTKSFQILMKPSALILGWPESFCFFSLIFPEQSRKF